MLSANAGGACVAADFMRISMKFQIVVLRHVTSAMGILRHFSPGGEKNTNFPQPQLVHRCSSFVVNRKSRVQRTLMSLPVVRSLC